MKEIKVGQRVAVYGKAFGEDCEGTHAEVKKVLTDGWVKVRVLDKENGFKKKFAEVHPKQLRRLIKKSAKPVAEEQQAPRFDTVQVAAPEPSEQSEPVA